MATRVVPVDYETQNRVKAVSQGEGRGVNVSIPRSLLEEVGVDPDGELEVSRYAMGEGERTVGLRFHESDDGDRE